ncbi:MAG: hypothetical protein MUF25_24860 [Pirellulaceae bacterium]|nr:hypothetical protein [Pirellulaceae bacterium]
MWHATGAFSDHVDLTLNERCGGGYGPAASSCARQVKALAPEQRHGLAAVEGLAAGAGEPGCRAMAAAFVHPFVIVGGDAEDRRPLAKHGVDGALALSLTDAQHLVGNPTLRNPSLQPRTSRDVVLRSPQRQLRPTACRRKRCREQGTKHQPHSRPAVQ